MEVKIVTKVQWASLIFTLSHIPETQVLYPAVRIKPAERRSQNYTLSTTYFLISPKGKILKASNSHCILNSLPSCGCLPAKRLDSLKAARLPWSVKLFILLWGLILQGWIDPLLRLKNSSLEVEIHSSCKVFWVWNTLPNSGQYPAGQIYLLRIRPFIEVETLSWSLKLFEAIGLLRFQLLAQLKSLPAEEQIFYWSPYSFLEILTLWSWKILVLGGPYRKWVPRWKFFLA